MSKPKTDLALRVRDKTLEMLMEKEPEEISARDISKACGVTTTCIYYYYKNMEALLTEVKFFCIKELDKFVFDQVAKKSEKHRKSGKNLNPLEEFRTGLEVFRDWAFANPRIALLIMERMKPDIDNPEKAMDKYYQIYFFAKALIDRAVEAGLSDSKDTLQDASLCIAALWGTIESVLLNRTIPKYWSKRAGLGFTNKMIDLLLASLTKKN